MQQLHKISNSLRKKAYLAVATLFAVASLAPMLASQSAQAATLTTRSLSLSSNRNTGTATYTFTATTSATTGGVEFAFCTSPLVSTTCTSPTGLAVAGVTVTSSPAGFAVSTAGNAPACGITNNAAPSSANTVGPTSGNSTCAVRAQHATTVAAGATTFTVAGVSNPTVVGTFFVRIATYSSSTFGTFQDSGTVAQSVSAATNVSFKVQEILQVCAGGTTVDAAGTSLAGSGGAGVAGDTCNSVGVAGYLSAVDLGIADPTIVRVTPVASGGSTGGNGTNGFVMVRTNAANGASIQYRAVQDTSSGELKVPGASCNANPSTITTDSCINSVPNTQAVGSDIVAGTERFGMSSTYINKTAGADAAFNLVADSNYDGTGTTGSTCTPASGVNCWTWEPSGTTATVASSTASAVKQLDDEAVILKFAATSGFTTPSGAYQVNVDFFAVPVF